MTVLIEILKILGVLLGLLLVLLLWLILIPRNIWVEYSKKDGLSIKVNIAFFKAKVYPFPKFAKKKETKPKEEKKPRQTGEESANILKELEFSFDLIKQVITSAKGIVKKIFAALKFRDVSFTLPVYMGDILTTQQTHGMVSNSFYALSVFLQSNIDITFKSPIIIADFADSYSDALYFYTKITASPILMLAGVYYAYTQYELITENYKKTATADKKEIKNG